MVALRAAIDALDTVSIILGMIPLVGDSLQSAVKLASEICEQIQNMKENGEGYAQLGVQVAELLTAIASVLQQQVMWNESLECLMQTNLVRLISVLEEIKAAVRKRLRSNFPAVRKRDRIRAWVIKQAIDVKRMYKDPVQLQDLRRKLQNVMDGFMVSSLLRNELNFLRNKSDVNAVGDLALRILDLLEQQDDKRHAEAERFLRDADIALLDSLKPITSAAWNADSLALQGTGANLGSSTPNMVISVCTPGTRVFILQDILTWAGASDDPCVFWLNGLAGTGKSTIARTLCERLQERGMLGASFFISRDHSDRRDASTIVRSLAYQLAVQSRPFSNTLCIKLREKPISATRSLQQHIADFIIAPACELDDSSSFILVIDALDECNLDSRGWPGGDLLPLLVRLIVKLSGRLKLFVTSRGELPIQRMFRELSAETRASVVKLHELDTTVVREDIATYLNHSFTRIRGVYPDFALDDWPSPEAALQLVHLSGLLFIYAATAVRFMLDRNHSPRARLDQLLEQGQSNSKILPYAQLDALYRQILSDATGHLVNEEEYLCHRLQAVLAVIVLAHTPLKIDALATISGVGPDGTEIVVGHLASLLADTTSGIRVFHPSFPDFCIDTARCTDRRLCVVPLVDHGVIAFRCFALMDHKLRYNMCNLEDATVANLDDPDLCEKLHANVSDALCYAACFWCTHLAASGSPEGLLLDALDKFCQKHLFHWVELLSLVHHVAPVETILPEVIEWCERYPSNTTFRVKTLLRDLSRVLQIFGIPIRSHALHVYHSAFVTMPQCVLLNTLAQQQLPPGLPKLVSPRAAQWGLSPRVLEGHSQGVLCVAYSLDGSRIASGSADCTVSVWNAVTFEQLAELKGHRDWVGAVAFSPDSTRIASGSEAVADTVRVWSAVTFEQLIELKGHRGPVHAVAFSQDGTRIISSSASHAVRVWSAVTFEKLADLEGHQGTVFSVGVSPDDMRVISGSDDRTVRVWDAGTHKQLAKLEGHRGLVLSVTFSFHGTRIVSGSADCTLRVWDAVNFKQLAVMEGHRDWVHSVAVAHKSTHIVSGSEDHSVRVWDAVTFEQVAELEGHQGGVRSVAYSPSGVQIISGSDDRTVRIWDAVSFNQLVNLKLTGHRDEVQCASFSPDGARLISGARDWTLGIWNTGTFEGLVKLERLPVYIHCLAFSPDGTLIVTGSDDETVRVWNAATFEELAKLDAQKGLIVFVAFSRDSNFIVSRDYSDVQRTWMRSSRDAIVTWMEITTVEIHPRNLFIGFAEMEITLSDSGWLSCVYAAEQTLLWLPVERRGHTITQYGRHVAIGAQSGAITLLKLPNKRSGLDRLCAF